METKHTFEFSVLNLCICISALKTLCKYIKFQTYFYATNFVALDNMALHCITSHYIALHSITSHYIALHRITLHYIALHCITLHYIALHSITLHYITLHCIMRIWQLQHFICWSREVVRCSRKQLKYRHHKLIIKFFFYIMLETFFCKRPYPLFPEACSGD